MENSITDRILSQDFHQRFLIEISNFIIIVVGKLTLSDQKNLRHLLNLIPKSKEVAIIHNFYNLSTQSIIEEYISNDIINGSFDNIIEKKLNEKLEKQRFFVTSNQNVYHLILANKFSEAGNFYNFETLNYLRNKIKNLTIMKEFNIEKNLIEFLNENKKNYIIGDNFNFHLKKIDENVSEIRISYDHSQEKSLNEIKLKEPVLDSFGFIQFSQNVFKEIPYEIYYNHEELILSLFLHNINEENLENVISNIKIDDIYQIICLEITTEELEERNNYNTFFKSHDYTNQKIEFCSCRIPDSLGLLNNNFKVKFNEKGKVNFEFEFIEKKKKFNFKKKKN